MGKKTKSNSAVAKAPWNRTGNVSVDVDQVRIDSLLQQRSDCKANKNFGEADEIAKTLRDMNVCYHDDKREWYTKDSNIAVSFHAGAASNINRTKSKKQERNRRQALKNRKKAAGGEVEADAISATTADERESEEQSKKKNRTVH